MNEIVLSQLVIELLSPYGHIDKIETMGVANGRPDLNYCIDGEMGDLELKVLTRAGCKIRPSQKQWARKRLAAGGRFFLLYYDTTQMEFGLIRGEDVPQLQNRKVTFRKSAYVKWPELDAEDLRCELTKNTW